MRGTRLVGLIAAAATVLATAGCEVGHSDVGHDTASPAAIPAIADVSPAADPRGHHGVVQVALPEVTIDPVIDDPTPDLPTNVVDHQGTEVVVEDVSRILALDIYGTLAHTVFELGLGHQVVGRDVSTQFPQAADLPLVTQNGHELNAEAILDLDPTLVITDTSLGPWQVVEQLRDAGVTVVVVDPERSIDNLAALTQQVADALGLPEVGRELGDRIQAQADAVRADIEAVAPTDDRARLRAVFLYVRGSAGVYYMFGEGSGAQGLLQAVGAYDVAAEIGWAGMRPITDEGLVHAQPDVIVMMTGGLDSVGGIDGLIDRFPAIAQTPAGEQQRVVAMPDTQILSFGPRAAEVLNALAVALYAPEELS
ncbi:heme/hemin ABC transporter substrate-binding protein [Nocardioides limicola]|uniref:heme/hemin ABC transporter substrate-binding protein n=1 Tax=Nocardioides limicola TaxID=2803368 RepID=UPI00193B1E54|nr:ABC transporter substrate-binding protein [Nocardioides sp. DJM-14]